VPGAQCLVHATPRQSGAASRVTHAVGWQHVAGTQSASARQTGRSFAIDGGPSAHAPTSTSERTASTSSLDGPASFGAEAPTIVAL
jgi:hypothetical protein